MSLFSLTVSLLVLLFNASLCQIQVVSGQIGSGGPHVQRAGRSHQLPRFQPTAPPKRFMPTCYCRSNQCYCGANLKFQEAGIEEELTANLAYEKSTDQIEIRVNINGMFALTQKVSAAKPLPFCFNHLLSGKQVHVCVGISEYSRSRGCAQVWGYAWDKKFISSSEELGCFHLEMTPQVAKKTTPGPVNNNNFFRIPLG